MAKAPKRPKSAPKPSGAKSRTQVNVGLTPALAKRVRETAETLHLDGANLLRMIIAEHLHEYEARAQKVRDAAPKG